MARAQAGNRHKVAKGDTLFALSRRYGISTRALIEANSLREPYILKIGRILRLVAPRQHRVARGETSYGISRRYGVNLGDLVRLNRLEPPYRLAVGQVLILPQGSTGGTAQATRPAPLHPAPPRPVRTPPAEGSRFAWPLVGPVISRFGPKKGGVHNDGINIRAKPGTPVRVADAGVVIYAADDLEGYGNLVLVRHQGGWITAYAHNHTLAVKEGDRVERGQPIASVGRSGGVPEPQLHFEIRKGREALDPQRYLAPRAR